MKRITEYDNLYIIKNKTINKIVLMYWASSQKHKALFSSFDKASDALKNIKDDSNDEYEIIMI